MKLKACGHIYTKPLALFPISFLPIRQKTPRRTQQFRRDGHLLAPEPLAHRDARQPLLLSQARLELVFSPKVVQPALLKRRLPAPAGDPSALRVSRVVDDDYTSCSNRARTLACRLM